LTLCKGKHFSAVSAYGETIQRSYRSFLISRICRDRKGRKEGVGKREDEEKNGSKKCVIRRCEARKV
jgi:hypothetical protein